MGSTWRGEFLGIRELQSWGPGESPRGAGTEPPHPVPASDRLQTQLFPRTTETWFFPLLPCLLPGFPLGKFMFLTLSGFVFLVLGAGKWSWWGGG